MPSHRKTTPALRTPVRSPVAAGSSSKRRSGGTMQPASTSPPATVQPLSRLATIILHLQNPAGASIDELCAATGWQQHSIRGALAGAVKHKGHIVTSAKKDGTRRYRISSAP